MKKSKLSITLVTSFIAAMALTACNDVKAKDGAIVSFKPYGAKEAIALATKDMYNSYRGKSNGISMFYDKILEVLTRYKFQHPGDAQFDMSYDAIQTWAKNQVEEQKDKARANAKSNKTSYDDEWKSILESYNVEKTDELKEKFIYDKEKEIIKNWYADKTENAEALKKEFLGLDADGHVVDIDSDDVTVDPAMPYHIRHILVKVDEAADAQSKFYRGTITEAQAKLLSDTVTTLAAGNYNFSQVAKLYSEDGSASNGGDVGIMTNAATSGSLGMVNEFQLGLYAYDNLYDAGNISNTEGTNIKKGLGMDADVISALPGQAVEIPYSVFTKLGKYANVTADKEGNKLANGSQAVYPRNILWNKYLNLHNVFVITNKKAGDAQFDNDGTKDAATVASEFDKLVKNEVDPEAPTTDRFKNGLLVDENENVIIGVRSQYGIHFMIIEKSMYDNDLLDYYTTLLPNDAKYPTGKDTYVGFIQSQSTEDYKKRSDDVKSKITSFDSTYDYRLYQDLSKELNVSFTGIALGLGDEIDQYISLAQENNKFKQADGLHNVWRTYTELIEVQEANRDKTFTTINPISGGESNILSRLVSEQIAEDFFKLYDNPGANAGLYAKFNEGGDYYYYA